MTVIATKLNENDYPLWNDFIMNSSRGSFFYTTEWANLLSYTFDRQFEVIVLQDDDQIIGGLIVFVQKRFGYRMITPVALYPYCGPILEKLPDAKYQKKIASGLENITCISEYLINNFDFWTINTSPEIKDIRSFQWQNCRVEPSYTYQLALKNWNACQQNFNQSVRKKVRQAEKENTTFKQSDEKNSFIRMYLHSYHRHGIKPLIDEKILDNFLTMALKLPQVKLYYVEKEDKKLAGRIILEDTDKIYDLLAGSDDPEGHGSSYLVYKILELYSGNEFVFDFLGADHPQIEEFKRGFGGQLANGFRISSPVKFPLSWMIRMRARTIIRNRKL